MMLAPPTVGIARSINKHNSNLDTLCDWVEGSILFDDGELSASDIVDALIENNIYAEQDFAWQIMNDAWNELKRRQGLIGNGAPIEIMGQRLRRLRAWQDSPAHSFCIALAYTKWYPNWARQFGNDYNEQGELFETLTKEALRILFPDWEIHPTGWTRTRVNRLGRIVKDIASRLGEIEGEVERWTNDKAHEAGLDLLCYRPFGDGRVGVPVFLMQCGSGGHWDGKLHTPNLRIWTKIVQFASDPKKAFAMPYALLDKEFRQNCNLVNGLLLDRYRLLSAGRNDPDWVSVELKTDIVAWLEPRIEMLPRDDE